MKKFINYPIYISIAATFIAVQSCYVDFDDHRFGCENGHGQVVTESRSLTAFSGVTNTIGADITIRQHQNREFTISAPHNILRNVTTSVVDGELIIDYRGCYRNAEIDIYIANPEISSVHNIGSGDIYGENPWQSEQLDLTITGSGKIDAEFNTHLVRAEITGSGYMDLYGTVDHSEIFVSGSGSIFGFNLESNDQEVHISGSGNCEVMVRDVLDVTISGSGNVFYKGNPTVSSEINGSGRVIKSN